eukprot:TRINITY_DN91828_c0_g1_i1.p1 TRINITY_DN91828_c0_g1~~TRINITY_DN91828_c0_g1_i1.p1  ORF type:complete len:138 (+),score=12.15 TRINITY_DN91828_c0_g1_i1:529-942(+)
MSKTRGHLTESLAAADSQTGLPHMTRLPAYPAKTAPAWRRAKGTGFVFSPDRSAELSVDTAITYVKQRIYQWSAKLSIVSTVAQAKQRLCQSTSSMVAPDEPRKWCFSSDYATFTNFKQREFLVLPPTLMELRGDGS